MHLRLTKEEFDSRGGVFDQIMDLAFEAAVLVDPECRVVHYSAGSYQMSGRTPGEMEGQPIGAFSAQLFKRVMNTGAPMIGELIFLYGKRCIANAYPVYDEERRLMGVFSFLQYRKLSPLKKVLSNLEACQIHADAVSYDTLARLETGYTFSDYIGQSQAVAEMLRLCQRASATPHPVLLLGETGTGKELLSHAIHETQAADRAAPFIKINCTAIPNDLLESELFGHEKGAFTGASALKKGKFEMASGGSILLDEIGDMDLRLQGKLLRVLEEREFERVGGNTLIPLNARVIASTNRNLQELCREGRFRLDLYYRLNALEIQIPPLRARKEDIPLLVGHFLRENQPDLAFTREAMGMLVNHEWPGNVRELKNLILRLGIISEKAMIDAADLQPYMPSVTFQRRKTDRSPAKTEADSEKKRIETVLKECRYNLSASARHLCVSRATLYSKIRKHRIEVPRLCD